jgi:hypothetical protein
MGFGVLAKVQVLVAFALVRDGNGVLEYSTILEKLFHGIEVVFQC